MTFLGSSLVIRTSFCKHFSMSVNDPHGLVYKNIRKNFTRTRTCPSNPDSENLPRTYASRRWHSDKILVILRKVTLTLKTPTIFTKYGETDSILTNRQRSDPPLLLSLFEKILASKFISQTSDIVLLKITMTGSLLWFYPLYIISIISFVVELLIRNFVIVCCQLLFCFKYLFPSC